MKTTFISLGHKIKKQTKLLVGITVGFVVGGAGIASVYAVIPDTTGVIHACYRTSNGSIRIIDSPTQTCASNEAALDWNSATPGQFVTNLVGADFSNGDVRYRNFAGADLHDANFDSATFVGAVFDNANLTNATFATPIYGPDSRNHSGRASFNGSNLSQAKFTNAIQIDESDFRNANFSSTIVDPLSAFIRSNFTGVDFTTAVFNAQAVHQGPATLFQESDLSNANFNNQNLSNFNLYSNIATNTDFSNVDFSHSSLSQTNLSTAILTGVTWSNTQCPDNTNSDNNGNTCIGHLVP